VETTSGRLLTLLSLLQARRDWPGTLLAERLEVSQRTIRRDVDRLRDLGYPVRATMGPDGGYRLDAGADLPPLLFDDEQAVALAVALQLAAVSGAGIADAAWRALATVRQVMPGRLRHRVDSVRVIGMPRAGDAEIDTSALVAVSEAVRDREQLRFDYRPATGGAAAEPDRRQVEPHHVLNRGGRWYLLGWDLDRGDWRIFRVDRMVPRCPPAHPSAHVRCPAVTRRRTWRRGSTATPTHEPASAGPVKGRSSCTCPPRRSRPIWPRAWSSHWDPTAAAS